MITPRTRTHYILNDGGHGTDAYSLSRFPHLADPTDPTKPLGYPIANAPTLNRIATDFYGRDYVGQQCGDGGERDMLSNDSVYEFCFPTMEEVEQTLAGGFNTMAEIERSRAEYLEMFKVPHMAHLKNEAYVKLLFDAKSPDETGGRGWLNWWIKQPGIYGSYQYEADGVTLKPHQDSIEHIRMGPPVDVMIAALIEDEQLPLGDYLLYVSW